MKIISIKAYEILDSRGVPTVEAVVELAGGVQGSAMVPSGASTGSREAVEKRDGDPKRFGGKGVKNAVASITGPILNALKDRVFETSAQLDGCLCELDGTAQKSRLGANAILAVSLAFARARANALGQPLFKSCASVHAPVLPVPLMNILNGGAHADNALDIQECMIIPVTAPTFAESVRYGAEIIQALKSDLKAKGLSTGVGDEGGFAPEVASTTQALDWIMQAIERVGFKPGREIYLGLDLASTEFFKEGWYHLAGEKLRLDSDGWIEHIAGWVKHYPILSLEDPMAEDDWTGFSQITARLGDRVQIVGDDLFTTQVASLQKGLSLGAGNAILIKLNQVGTLTETLSAITLAEEKNWGVVISHRSGETEDAFIADLALGSGAGQIKTGSLCRSERLAKYNQLIRLEEVTQAPFKGRAAYAQWLGTDKK